MGQGRPLRPARLRAYAVAEIVDFLGRDRSGPKGDRFEIQDWPVGRAFWLGLPSALG